MTTPATPSGEPEVKPAVGTAVDPAPSDAPVTEKSAAELTAEYEAKLAASAKEVDKAKMRTNQLENQIKDGETAALKEKEDYKALAEKYEADLNQIKADADAKAEADAQAAAEADAQKQAVDFRDKVIDAYPENVQKAARALIEKNPSNLLWKDAETWDDAETQLTDQLDALAELMGEEAPVAKQEEKKPKVSANNPSGTANKVDPTDLTWQEMRKVLPHAEDR